MGRGNDKDKFFFKKKIINGVARPKKKVKFV